MTVKLFRRAVKNTMFPSEAATGELKPILERGAKLLDGETPVCVYEVDGGHVVEGTEHLALILETGEVQVAPKIESKGDDDDEDQDDSYEDDDDEEDDDSEDDDEEDSEDDSEDDDDEEASDKKPPFGKKKDESLDEVTLGKPVAQAIANAIAGTSLPRAQKTTAAQALAETLGSTFSGFNEKRFVRLALMGVEEAAAYLEQVFEECIAEGYSLDEIMAAYGVKRGEVVGKVQEWIEMPLEEKAKLGSGARFKALAGKLAKKGVNDPKALAATIGRKKYGKAKFQKLAAQGESIDEAAQLTRSHYATIGSCLHDIEMPMNYKRELVGAIASALEGTGDAFDRRRFVKSAGVAMSAVETPEEDSDVADADEALEITYFKEGVQLVTESGKMVARCKCDTEAHVESARAIHALVEYAGTLGYVVEEAPARDLDEGDLDENEILALEWDAIDDLRADLALFVEQCTDEELEEHRTTLAAIDTAVNEGDFELAEDLAEPLLEYKRMSSGARRARIRSLRVGRPKTVKSGKQTQSEHRRQLVKRRKMYRTSAGARSKAKRYARRYQRHRTSLRPMSSASESEYDKNPKLVEAATAFRAGRISRGRLLDIAEAEGATGNGEALLKWASVNEERKPTAKQLAKKLASDVETTFYKHFNRVQIPMMKIPPLYKEIEGLLTTGADLELEMPKLVQKYRVESTEEGIEVDKLNPEVARAVNLAGNRADEAGDKLGVLAGEVMTYLINRPRTDAKQLQDQFWMTPSCAAAIMQIAAQALAANQAGPAGYDGYVTQIGKALAADSAFESTESEGEQRRPFALARGERADEADLGGHQKKIALATLKMHSIGAKVMGGMSHGQAVQFLVNDAGYSLDKVKGLLTKAGHSAEDIERYVSDFEKDESIDEAVPSWSGADAVYSRAYKVLAKMGGSGHATAPTKRRGKIVASGSASEDMRKLIDALNAGDEEEIKGLLLQYRDRFPEAFESVDESGDVSKVVTICELIYNNAFDGAVARKAGKIEKATSHERTVDRAMKSLKQYGDRAIDQGEAIEHEAQRDGTHGTKHDFGDVWSEVTSEMSDESADEDPALSQARKRLDAEMKKLGFSIDRTTPDGKYRIGDKYHFEKGTSELHVTALSGPAPGSMISLPRDAYRAGALMTSKSIVDQSSKTKFSSKAAFTKGQASPEDVVDQIISWARKYVGKLSEAESGEIKVRVRGFFGDDASDERRAKQTANGVAKALERYADSVKVNRADTNGGKIGIREWIVTTTSDREEELADYLERTNLYRVRESVDEAINLPPSNATHKIRDPKSYEHNAEYLDVPAYKLAKATVFMPGGYGWVKREVNDLVLWTGKYAQYDNALHVQFREKGKRKTHANVYGYNPRIVVFEGWGIDLDVEDPFEAPKASSVPGVTIQKGKRLSQDSGWDTEMGARVANYKGKKPVVSMLESESIFVEIDEETGATKIDVGDLVTIGGNRRRQYLILGKDKWGNPYGHALSGTEKGSQLSGAVPTGTVLAKVGTASDAKFSGAMAGKLRVKAEAMRQMLKDWKAHDIYTGELPFVSESEGHDVPKGATVSKGTYYWKDEKAAIAWAKANGWPTDRVNSFGRGYAVQAGKSGNYAGPGESPREWKGTQSNEADDETMFQREDGEPVSVDDVIRVGDRVTIYTPQKQKRSGRAVMRGLAGWVLNMGGPHGTPGIATDKNVSSIKRGNKTIYTDESSAPETVSVLDEKKIECSVCGKTKEKYSGSDAEPYCKECDAKMERLRDRQHADAKKSKNDEEDESLNEAKYQGYTIKKDADDNYRVTTPKGETWEDPAVNMATARKWIDADLAEKRAAKRADETTIAKYEVQQKRSDSPVESHMHTSKLGEAKAKALALSKTDENVAYVVDGDKPVCYYKNGKELTKDEYRKVIGLRHESLDEARKTKIRSAVLVKSIPGATVGITRDEKIILFRTDDYDSKGTLNGPFVTLGTEKYKYDALWLDYNDGFDIDSKVHAKIRTDAAAAFQTLKEDVDEAESLKKVYIVHWSDPKNPRGGPAADGSFINRFKKESDAQSFAKGKAGPYGQGSATVDSTEVGLKLWKRWNSEGLIEGEGATKVEESFVDLFNGMYYHSERGIVAESTLIEEGVIPKKEEPESEEETDDDGETDETVYTAAEYNAIDEAKRKKMKGVWRTTAGGRKIFIENGKVTKGNPHLLAALNKKH